MNFEKYVADHAVAISLAFLATLFIIAAFLVAAPARSQSIEIGPGGIAVSPQRERGWGGQCEELRIACEYKMERGEEGQGNCRRYRRFCQWSR
jgi:hypothetical protein